MTPVSNSTSKQVLEYKLDLLEDVLNHKQSWYTGIPLKKYLQKTIFSQFNEQNPKNLALESDRWSAYSHYSNISAFVNLLDKHEVNDGMLVLVHPLLPSEFIDILIARGAKLLFCDIHLDNLSFEPRKFREIFNDSNQTPQLVIHYIDNGLYFNVQQLLKKHSPTIPSLIYANNNNITPELLDLMQAHFFGSFLFNFGDSFFDNILDTVLEKPLTSKKWTVSWYIENRMKSSPEYHLSSSQECYIPIIESYYSLILDQYMKSGLKSLPYIFKHKFARTMKKFDKKNSQKIIQKSYANIGLAAVPDIVFELELAFPTQKFLESFYEISHFSHQIKLRTKELNGTIIAEKNKTKEISNYIPAFFETATYLKYFFYTSDKYFWASWAYKLGLKIYEQQPLHPALDKDKLPNSIKISNEIVYFDTVEIIS